ncbi:hypothetical protein TURU_018500 [Turdus rufiventris]|nr:hypothetical protein TURU_018500 [Turdus rufiventris]
MALLQVLPGHSRATAGSSCTCSAFPRHGALLATRRLGNTTEGFDSLSSGAKTSLHCNKPDLILPTVLEILLPPERQAAVAQAFQASASLLLEGAKLQQASSIPEQGLGP